jgi:hypothetical protein
MTPVELAVTYRRYRNICRDMKERARYVGKLLRKTYEKELSLRIIKLAALQVFCSKSQAD